ncbi:uncharacterized protein LOC134682909 [Mytilus trossulus]|uniref:uncharacterized protein LOC134682909 n=1 Tax=Mytilus trossulus TaxID=6551 RepID=UPI003007D5B0
MTSSIDTPILIDSDNDSDVEILREERNEDLDIIFVSETIHVKEEEKPSAENIKSESKPCDTSFNRSLSISSNLDLTLRLTDNPTPPSVDQTPCSNTNSSMSAIDHAPLDLSSKAKYDDITDSSEEGSSEDDYDEDDDDDEDTGSDDPFAIKGPDNGGSILSMPRLYNSDQTQPSNCCSKPQSFNISDILSTGNSTQGRKKLPSQIRVLKSYNQTLQPIDSVSSYQIKQDCTQSVYSSMTSAGPQQTQHQNNDQSTQSMAQQTICNSVHYQQTLTLKESHDKMQSQQGIWNPSDHASQSNLSTSGTNSVNCNPSFSSSPNKTVTDICDELLQDLDFLNSSNNSLSSHSKLCKTTSSGDQELKTSPPAVGIKRTLSEQNLKSKSDDKILPPKKQTRYLYHQSSEETQSSSWGSEKCSQCQMSLLGLKLSRCLQGHPSCTTCLEEKVKVVLTGKAKETLHCLKPGCNSYFPIGELNQSLPKMVVDILETKLDDDYIDYIANMILKNASSSEDSGHNINSQEVPSVPENRSTGCTADNKLERNKDLPDNWTVMDRKKTHDLIALEPESPEYVDVVFKFHESMKFPLADICKVSRIQNPILWQFFNVKRSEMIQENDGIDVEERKLFHGTQAAIVESICKKGFDWRVCGKNGTVYGQGCYFAVNANYSHQYTDKPTRRNRLPRPFMPVPPPAHFHIHGGTGLMVPIMVNPLSMNLGPGQFGQQPNNNSASQNFQQLRVYTRPSTSSNTSQGNCLLYTNIQAGQQVSTQNNGASGQRAVGSQSPSVIVNSQYGQPQVVYQSNPAPPPMVMPEIQEEKPMHRMILSRVLVGKYTGGNANYRKPPPLFADDPSGRYYDSCVDHIHSPKIFVIFDSAQAYPEYLIEYNILSE